MKKLTFLSLFSLVTINCLFGNEYISDEYFAKVASASIDSLPIAKTVEEQAREKKESNTSLLHKPIALIIEEKDKVLKAEVSLPPISEGEYVKPSPYLQALKRATIEGKIIMLAIRATHCHYCDRMDAETLNDSSVKAELEDDFITLYYNQDLEPLPLGLQEGMTPKFVFVNTNEDILNMYPGMRNPDEFKEVLEQILDM